MPLIKYDLASSDNQKKIENDKKEIKKLIKTMPTISFQHMEGCGPCGRFMPIWDEFVDKLEKLPDEPNLLIVKLESKHADDSVLPSPPHFPFVNKSPENSTEHTDVPPHKEGLEKALETVTDKLSTKDSSPEHFKSPENKPDEEIKGGGKRKKRKTRKNHNKKGKRKFTRKPQKYKSKTFKKKYSYKKVRFASKKKYRKTPRY